MQVIAVAVVLAEAADKEIPKIVFFFPDHVKSRIEEFRENDEIYGDVRFSGREDFLDCVLVQEQQLPCF